MLLQHTASHCDFQLGCDTTTPFRPGASAQNLKSPNQQSPPRRQKRIRQSSISLRQNYLTRLSHH